ncbi:hypothetical protein ABT294_09125 [Nonomuraea sp. NPDC000554]|uniref:hypothetical protein n=1 Tax=Nonomuraea sp. NPDC000554 TaxID=3154259 RepID=UPI00332EC778
MGRRPRGEGGASDAAAIVTGFQNYVQHAEGKVNALLVLHAGAAAGVAAQTAAGVAAGVGGLAAFLGYCLLGLFLLGSLVSGYHLLQTIRPSLKAPDRPSRYGITGVAAPAPSADDDAERLAEAWAMARLLGEIAERKHRHVAQAVPWVGLTLVSALAWTVLIAVVR